MAAGIFGVVVVGLGIVQIVRPVVAPKVAVAVSGAHTIPGHLKFPWPSGVQAAEDVVGLGWIGGGQQGPPAPEPIGSVAKLMTALLVVKKYPLGAYASGPSLKMTSQDAALYQSDLNTQQSVMAVSAGQRISERELLEGLLIPSGNNVATMLSKWVAGSPKAFAVEMNQEAKQLGLTQTHYNGPVGLSPLTVSTVVDQVKLAEKVMQSPVLAAISGMPQMTLPNGQITYNYNNRLGRDGIFGVKTGSTVIGGASFIWAANAVLGGQNHTIYGGVFGVIAAGNQLGHAKNDGQALIVAATKVVGWHDLWSAGESVGRIKTAWSAPVAVAVSHSVRILGWPSLKYRVRFIDQKHFSGSKPVPKDTKVGILRVTYGSQIITVPVVTESRLPSPSLVWKLRRL